MAWLSDELIQSADKHTGANGARSVHFRWPFWTICWIPMIERSMSNETWHTGRTLRKKKIEHVYDKDMLFFDIISSF